MTRNRSTVLVATATLGVTLMSGCGGYDTTPTSAPAATQAQNVGTDSDAGNSAAVRLAARQINQLGTVVTDSNGMTLYRFDKDTAAPSVSNCEGPCLNLWPPVRANASEVQASGIDKGLLGTITRSDGSSQLTLNGWPLYRYTKDSAVGDANGQGVGQAWFAVTPLGRRAPAATAPADDPGYGSGY